MTDCALCDGVTGKAGLSEHWLAAMNVNQDRLGKCMLVLRRHDEDVCNLTDAETRDLWAMLRRVTAALLSSFGPDHFNYMFLMNQDAHVHLHVIPHYHSACTFAGIEWSDYDVLGGRVLRPSEPVFAQIVRAVSDRLADRSGD